MSADNTIAIVEIDGGFKVFHCQAVENMTDSEPEWARSFYDNYIKGAPCFSTREEARKHADKLYDECGYVEYGIQHFGQIANPYETPKPEPKPVTVDTAYAKHKGIYKATILSIVTRRTVVNITAENLTEALCFANAGAEEAEIKADLWRSSEWKTVQEHQEVMGIEFHSTILDEDEDKES